MRVRFNSHKQEKQKPIECLMMISIAQFTKEDVPELELSRWNMNVDQLALHHKTLLTETMQTSGWDMWTDEPGGGGRRANRDSLQPIALYMIVSVGNDDC